MLERDVSGISESAVLEAQREGDSDLFEIHRLGWQWFSILARQRIQLVSFWFVAMSFLTAAGMQAFTTGHLVAALGVCVALAGASVVFFLLDRRTRVQLGLGRRLLEDAERLIARRHHVPAVEVAKDLHRRGRRDFRYQTLFAWLYGGAFALSVAGALALVWQLVQA